MKAICFWGKRYSVQQGTMMETIRIRKQPSASDLYILSPLGRRLFLVSGKATAIELEQV